MKAGKMPKKMPTEAEKPMPMANDHHGSEIGNPDRMLISHPIEARRAPRRQHSEEDADARGEAQPECE